MVYGSGFSQPHQVAGRPWSDSIEKGSQSQDARTYPDAYPQHTRDAHQHYHPLTSHDSRPGATAVPSDGGEGRARVPGVAKGGGGRGEREGGESTPALPSLGVVKEEHEEMIRQYEATLAKLREDHNKRVAQLSEQHELEIQNTKERNFALVKKLEELETSDLVKAVGKGARIPAEISQEERDKLEKGLREQEVRIAAQYLYFCTSKLVQKCKN